jgi:hypothetical protein
VPDHVGGKRSREPVLAGSRLALSGLGLSLVCGSSSSLILNTAPRSGGDRSDSTGGRDKAAVARFAMTASSDQGRCQQPTSFLFDGYPQGIRHAVSMEPGGCWRRLSAASGNRRVTLSRVNRRLT